MTPAQRTNFERLLKPRHIAFIGGRDAIVAITEARRRNYAGKYWPVNPRRAELAGIECYPSIGDLPEAPDAVFLAIPAPHVVATVKRLAEVGAGGVVCYSAGFKEAGEAGAAAEVELIAAAGDMALIGPNCYGVINYLDNVALWPFAHGGSSPGYGAAIVTQSGMFSSDITMSQRSLPLAYMISGGNQAVIGIEECIDALCEQPGVRAIGVHIEGLKDVRRFEAAALNAQENNTPIVALKSGSSTIGAALTVSHTGSLSGANELYRALFARTGVISVTSPSQFLETLKFICVAGVPKGPRVAGFTCSGGGATMLADHAETIGLAFPDFTPAHKCTLQGLLPDIATATNPLDYTTPIWGQPELTSPVFECALRRDDIDAAVLVQDYPAPGLDESKILYQNDAKVFADAASARAVPAAICATIPENMDEQTRQLLIERGIAPMQGIHEALNAIRAAAAYGVARGRIRAAPPLALRPYADVHQFCPMDEADGKAWLKSRGITVPEGKCGTGKQAAEIAIEIGFPVALKMMCVGLPHKSEAGAVMLGLGNADEMVVAVDRMRSAVQKYAPHAVMDKYLVEAMSPAPLAELVVGIRRDPQFGFAMTIGSGGVLVELIGDVATLLLPCRVADIRSALSELRVARLLNGFRGRPKADLDLLAAALHGLGLSILNASETVGEVEINPLFVYADHVVAVDVLLQTAGQP